MVRLFGDYVARTYVEYLFLPDRESSIDYIYDGLLLNRESVR